MFVLGCLLFVICLPVSPLSPSSEPLYRQAIDICVKALGEEHPHTQTAKSNYEYFLRQKSSKEGDGE